MPQTRPIASNFPWIKERRRDQNAVAQRRSRARRKDRQQALQSVLRAESLSQNRIECTQNNYQRLSSGPVEHSRIAVFQFDLENDCSSSSLTSSYVFDSLRSELECANIAKIIAAENFDIRDIIKYGLISLGFAIDPAQCESGRHLPFWTWAERTKSVLCEELDMNTVAAEGIHILAKLNGPTGWPREIVSQAMSFLSASLANACHLGIAFYEVMGDDSESPFPLRRNRKWFKDIKPDLIPTTQQLNLPHHPFLDLIPWPSFRSKAIIAVSTHPPLIDFEDLCLDLANDGLRCWGATSAPVHGRGEGASWDSRSWEAMPWFLSKWEILAGDQNSDIHSTSSWWRSQYLSVS